MFEKMKNIALGIFTECLYAALIIAGGFILGAVLLWLR